MPITEIKCENVKRGCPKRFALGAVFAPTAKAKSVSECCSGGGGYYQGYEIECLICGNKWEEIT